MLIQNQLGEMAQTFPSSQRWGASQTEPPVLLGYLEMLSCRHAAVRERKSHLRSSRAEGVMLPLRKIFSLGVEADVAKGEETSVVPSPLHCFNAHKITTLGGKSTSCLKLLASS